MVEKVLNLFNREWSSLNEAAFLLGLSSFISQVLSLFRDRLLAGTFGAGHELDIYYSAFRIPDIIYVSVASLVSITILIPFIIRHLDSDDKDGARELINSVFTLFFILMIVVAVVAFIFIPYFAPLVAPGFDVASQAHLIDLSRILLLSPILLGLSNLFGSVTQSFKRFFIYALSPILYNIGIIIGVLYFYPSLGLKGLVWGVILGALLHLLIQAPTMWGLKLFPKFTFKINWNEIKRLMELSLPRTFTLSVHQITILVLVALASLMDKGSIAVFNFAYNLQSVPLAIVGLSYSVAAFPTLVKIYNNGDRPQFVTQVSDALRYIVFWSIPAMAIFIVLRAQIVRVILGSGEFDWSDTRLTAAALACFSISVIAQSLILLFVRAYYAAGKTSKPLVINVVSSIFVVLLSFVLNSWYQKANEFQQLVEGWLRVEAVGGTIVLILPIAFSTGMLLNLFLFCYFFRKDFGKFGVRVMRTFWQVFFASIISAVASYLLLNVFDNWFDLDTFIGILLQGLLAGVGGIVVGFGMLRLAKSQELTSIVESLRNRFWQTRVAAESPGEI